MINMSKNLSQTYSLCKLIDKLENFLPNEPKLFWKSSVFRRDRSIRIAEKSETDSMTVKDEKIIMKAENANENTRCGCFYKPERFK